jgi:hypothetical protein
MRKESRTNKEVEAMEKEKLKEISEELIEEMDIWTASHSDATFLEREVKARELASKLEAGLIEESAKEKAREEQQRPSCPHCQGPLQWRGERVRRLQASMGRAIELKRKYATCPKCGTGFFPPRRAIATATGKSDATAIGPFGAFCNVSVI